MRSTTEEIVKGVATMRFLVAVLLVLTMFSSGAVTLGQNPPRRTADKSAPKSQQSKSDTIKICQGVPMPDGYVIVGYLTSTACPHGAYLLKKQNDYESSLGANGAARSPADKTGNGSGPAARGGSGGPATSQASSTSSSQSSTGAATVTRPRVVASAAANQPGAGSQINGPRTGVSSDNNPASDDAAQDSTDSVQGPPTLIGAQSARPSGPPSLLNSGAASSTAANTSAENAAAATGPEEVSEGDVVKVNTSLVTVPVSVLDHQGRFISNLQRDDFRIFENGVEQSVAYFEPAEKPFTVALLLDTSASTHFHLQEIREAAIAFAKQLRPQDRVLIVSFNDEVLLLTEATNDQNLIETVIDEEANTGSSTRLYDAVHLTIRDRLNKIKGRKAMVLFTDGVDTSSQQATYQGTLREVEELDALIYPIQYDTTDYLRSMQNAGSGTVTVVTKSRGPFGTTTSQQTYNNVPLNGGLP